MRFEKLTFENAEGLKLSARLDLPVDGPPTAYALFAHCFTCGKNLRVVADISRALSSRGIAVLRFDFTGLGESEGDFAATDFSTNVDDLVAAARFLEADYAAPELLIGHSLGGAAVLAAAAQIPSANAIATINAPAGPEHVLQHMRGELAEIEANGQAEVELAGRRFTISRAFVDNVREAKLRPAVEALRAPLLLLHAPRDATVSFTNASRLREWAGERASLVVLDGADHLLSAPDDAAATGAILAAWAGRYMSSHPERVFQATSEGNRVTARLAKKGFRTDIAANGHRLTSDEPVAAGGTNLGPTPYELILSGLGACTVMTLRMYAERKGWPLRGAAVRLRHERIHAEDCADCSSNGNGARIDHIECELDLDGPLDDDQRQRLLEIAEKCPVHRTLTSETRIDTRLVEDL